MFRRLALVAIALMALCGCDARYPTLPTRADDVARLLVQYRFPTSSVQAGSIVSFNVLAVSSDGLYTDVTAQSQYFSSDLTVVRPTNVGIFTSVGPGAAEVVASYLGYTASMPVRVRSQTLTYPYIELSGLSSVAGSTASIRAILWSAPSQNRLITTEAVWKSSNSSIAAVNAGSVETFRVGTTEITASLGSVSESIYFSVSPRN